MTNTQLYFAVGLPITAVLASLVVSLFQISGIREEMRSLRTEMNTKMDMLLAKFYEHDTAIERLKDKTGLN